MKKILPILVSLGATLAVLAAPGDSVTLSASGTTSAQVIFPAGTTPGNVVSLNATADNATNRIFFYPTSRPRAVLIPNVAASSNVVTLAENSFTTNDVIIFQNAAGQLTNKTVTVRANLTNQLVRLMSPLGTNVAIGDVFHEVQATPYTPRHVHAANATTLFLDRTNNIDASDLLVLDRGPGLKPLLAEVDDVAAPARVRVNLNRTLPGDVAAGTAVHKQLSTNIAIRANAAKTDTTLYVALTNGMAANTNLIVETRHGARQIVAIDSLEGTNVTLLAGLDFAVTTNDWVRVLGYNTTTVLAEPAGGDALTLTAHTGFTANDVVLLDTTPPVRTQFGGKFTTNNLPTITLTGAFGIAVQPGHRIYEVTNTYTAQLASDVGHTSVVLDTATGLAVGDAVVLVKGNDDVSFHRIAPGTSDHVMTALTFSSAIGHTLDVGDTVWLEGTPANVLIGASTVTRDGLIYSQPTAGPLRCWLSGQSACSINSLTVRYRY